jgi:hypothetical protein
LKLWQKSLAWTIGVLVTLFVALQVLMFAAFSDLCGNDVWTEYPSPNGEYRAVIFQRDCGATTGFSTQVTILQRDNELPNRAGDILIIDGHPENVAPHANWLDADELVLHYRLTGMESLAAHVWTAPMLWDSATVKISYTP